ncbi:Crp/Fnr family transcriptional regulator [Porifericola rhodea]|uniref:Crp/Fnr family transcriptional regulator n=1 Tax=Porifericola rhodea TaxID=930972 RepID=UPI0026658CC0|nr:Crp/Fnr family transcriptional regulator [Porifericola rhodea]WKN30830.1 Crp/Fnr family transcriptional regulator [Porifericola rhodea]
MTSTDITTTPTQFSELVSNLSGHLQHYNKYDFIYLSPANLQKLFYVNEGLVRLGTYTEDGKEVTFCLVQEGALIGSFSFQDHQGKLFAQAYSELSLLSFSEWEMRSMFQQNSKFTFELIKMMGDQLRTMEEQFKMLAYQDVPQRILKFILYLAELYGYRHQRVTYIPHSFTHEDISRVVHTSRQTVTVTLRELQQKGYLCYRRGEFQIFHYEELLKLANKGLSY